MLNTNTMNCGVQQWPQVKNKVQSSKYSFVPSSKMAQYQVHSIVNFVPCLQNWNQVQITAILYERKEKDFPNQIIAMFQKQSILKIALYKSRVHFNWLDQDIGPVLELGTPHTFSFQNLGCLHFIVGWFFQWRL